MASAQQRTETEPTNEPEFAINGQVDALTEDPHASTRAR